MNRLTACSSLLLAFLPLAVAAQDKPAEKSETPGAEKRVPPAPYDPRITDCRRQPSRTAFYDCSQAHTETKVFQLVNVSQQNDANEILVALRNVFDPSIKIFLLASQNAIVIVSYPEELARVQALVKILDVPRKTFRLTYTLTDFDGDRRVGTQHFSMVAVRGQRTTLKQGSKIPVATGSYDNAKSSSQTQFTYLDVGMNFDATLEEVAGGVVMKSKVEQSSVAAEPANIAGVNEPIIRQAVIEGISNISFNKPLVLGSLDIAGSTHHLDIAVSVEPLP